MVSLPHGIPSTWHVRVQQMQRIFLRIFLALAQAGSMNATSVIAHRSSFRLIPPYTIPQWKAQFIPQPQKGKMPKCTHLTHSINIYGKPPCIWKCKDGTNNFYLGNTLVPQKSGKIFNTLTSCNSNLTNEVLYYNQ